MTIYKIRCPPGRLAALCFSALLALTHLAAAEDHADAVGVLKAGPQQALWVADDRGFSAFALKSLKKSGTPEPQTQFRGQGQPTSIQIDSEGNIWGLLRDADSNGDDLIFEMTPSDLSEYETTHVMSPSVSIVTSCDGFPYVFKLDPLENVWTSCTPYSGPPEIVEYTKSQFGTSVSIPPAVSIEPSGAVYINAIQFDRSGNLWMAGATADQPRSVIMKLTQDQLNSSGTLAPALIITELDPTDGFDPIAMTFDHDGNLWTLWVNYPTPTTTGINELRLFRSRDLDGGGTIQPKPAVVLDPKYSKKKGLAFFMVHDLALDPAGNLWLGEGTPGVYGNIVELTASQIAKSGTIKKPAPVLKSDENSDNLLAVHSLTFGPLQ